MLLKFDDIISQTMETKTDGLIYLKLQLKSSIFDNIKYELFYNRKCIVCLEPDSFFMSYKDIHINFYNKKTNMIGFKVSSDNKKFHNYSKNEFMREFMKMNLINK